MPATAPKPRGDFDRFAHEATIATELSGIFGDARQQAEKAGRVEWVEFRNRTQDALEEELLKVWLLVWLWMLSGDDPMSTGAVRGRAFVRDQARGVAEGLSRNMQSQFQAGAPPGDIFTGRRGEGIAATEVTRTITRAETEARREQVENERRRQEERGERVTRTDRRVVLPGMAGPLDAGDGLKVIWRTVQDARVCPVCEPLHGEAIDTWGEQFPEGPPAHPNCRCDLEYISEE